MHQFSRHFLVYLFTLLLGLSSLQVVLGSSVDSFDKQGDGYQITNGFDTSGVISSSCTVNQNYVHCNEDLDHTYSSHHCSTCALEQLSDVLHSMIPATTPERLLMDNGTLKEFANLLFRPPKI